MARRIIKKEFKYALLAIPIIAVIILSILLILDARRDKSEDFKNQVLMQVEMQEKGDLISYILPQKGIYVPEGIAVLNGNSVQELGVYIMNLLGEQQNFSITIESDSPSFYSMHYDAGNLELMQNESRFWNFKVISEKNRPAKSIQGRVNYTVTVYADDEIYRVGKLTLIDVIAP